MKSLTLKLFLALGLVAGLSFVQTASAFTVLGTGAGALLGGDLTDPEDDGAADADVNYNATFSASSEPFFGGGEGAFNVFDNRVGGGNAKWCCAGPPVNVSAELDAGRHVLTHFTITSGNDVQNRDPRDWKIQGSIDGVNWTDIFVQTGAPGTSLFTARHQVLRFDAGIDYPEPLPYSHFRYECTAVRAGNNHQLNELEFFGNPVACDQIVGQVVRVTITSGQPLSLAEVQVFRKGVNLATGGTAFQTGNAAGGVASRAIDGNTNGAWGGGSVTHTPGGGVRYWEVNLGSSEIIDDIVVWNRTDCCRARLDGFKIEVFDAPGGNVVWESVNQSHVYRDHNPGGTAGRYVRVSRTGVGNKAMSLAEVEVYNGFDNVAFGKPTSQISTGFGGVAARAVDGNASGFWGSGSITHTNNENDPWWYVDLGATISIDRIRISNRRDCCQDRLDNYTVQIIPDGGNPATGAGAILADGPHPRPSTQDVSWGFDLRGDENAPTIYECPPLTLELGVDANCATSLPDLTGSVVALDDCSDIVTVTQTPAPGGALSVGQEVEVSFSITDEDGNESFCSTEVTVVDNTLPVVECPPNVTLDCSLTGNLFPAPKIRGQKVRISLPRQDVLSLAEVEVFQNGVNIGPSGTANQSSVGWSAPADRAIDGNANGSFGSGSVTHTDGTDVPWWEVDFGTDVEIDLIKIWNRTDCCSGRLEGYKVEVIDSGSAVVWSQDGNARPVWARAHVVSSTTVPGRFVRIERVGGGSRPMSIAEVEVMSGGANVATGGAASQSTTRAAGGAASRAIDGNVDGNWGANSTTHTNNETDPWWQVDLGASFNIEQINVWNRRGCCNQGRLDNYTLSVLDENGNVLWSMSGIDEPIGAASGTAGITQNNAHGMDVGRPVVSDNCGVLDMAFDEVFEVDPNCPQGGVLRRTWLAVDNSFNIGSCEQAITITDNIAPSITCPPDLEIQCDQEADPAQTGRAVATDNCDPNPAIGFTDEVISGLLLTLLDEDFNSGISGAIWSDSTGGGFEIYGPGGAGARGVQSTYDHDQNAGTPNVSIPGAIEVNDNAGPVVLTAQLDNSLVIAPSINGTLSFWAGRRGTGGANPTVSIENVTDSSTILASTTLTGLGNVWQLITIPVTFSAGDAGDVIAVRWNGGGNNSASGLQMTLVKLEVPVNSCANESTIIRTWTATDACGNASSCEQIIKKIDSTPPNLFAGSPLDNGGFEEPFLANGTWAVFPTLPGWFTVTGAGTEIQADPLLAPAYEGRQKAELNSHVTTTIAQTVETTPGQNYTLSFAFAARNDTPGGAINSMRVDWDGAELATVAAAPIPGNPTTWTLYSFNLPATSSTTEFRFTGLTPANSSYGNFLDGVQVVPTTLPRDVTVECDDVPEIAAMFAIDNCDQDVPVTVTEVRNNIGCEFSYELVRTWTATDACGNSSTHEQVVTVQDTTNPVITIPDDELVECDAVPAVGDASATDNCDSNPSAVFVRQTITPGVCEDSYTIHRLFRAMDSCGNTSEATQNITVQDTTAPVITTVPETEYVDCSGAQPEPGSGSGGAGADSGSGGIVCADPLQETVPAPPTIEFSDNCDDDPTLDFEEIPAEDCPGTIVRHWIVTDNCGWTDEVFQMIILKKACVRDQEYWKCNPDRWLNPMGAVETLDLGEGTFSAVDARAILCMKSKGDASVKVAQELIAAILNVEQGADDSCATVLIDTARAYLGVNAIGSDPSGELKKMGKDLAKALKAFNLGHCCAPVCQPEEGSQDCAPCASGSGGGGDPDPDPDLPFTCNGVPKPCPCINGQGGDYWVQVDGSLQCEPPQ